MVVSENLDPFRDILWFTNELVIPPLTKETALVMASTLKPNLKVYHFLEVHTFFKALDALMIHRKLKRMLAIQCNAVVSFPSHYSVMIIYI